MLYVMFLYYFLRKTIKCSDSSLYSLGYPFKYNYEYAHENIHRSLFSLFSRQLVFSEMKNNNFFLI